MNKLEWRRAASADIDDVWQLVHECVDESKRTGGHWSDEYPQREDIELDVNDEHTLMFFLDGQLCGSVCVLTKDHDLDDCVPWTKSENGRIIAACYPTRLCVRPAFRGKGLAKREVDIMLDYARGIGYEMERHLAAADYELVNTMYKEMGFSFVEQVSLWDCLFNAYEKRL